MLGERATTEITTSRDSKKFGALKQDAKEGGGIAGDARDKLEKKTGKKVSVKKNYLLESENNPLISKGNKS